MKFEIKLSRNNQFYFVLKAKNGEIIATSEQYKTKQALKKGISAVRRCLFATVIDNTL